MGHLILRLLLALAAGSPGAAADPPKVERGPAKEPAYRGKPKYCLLAFGPQAKARVWLVLDGDTLYVDRNGNGDLTEEGERVEVSKALSRRAKRGAYSHFNGFDLKRLG